MYQVVLIVGFQLMHAAAGDIHELYLHLGRSITVNASLSDVLFPASGSLHHLVDSSVSLGEKGISKIIGDGIDACRQLINCQILIIPALRQELMVIISHNALVVE